MKPQLIRPIYFVWLIVPAIALALYQAWGLPHVIWNYRYSGNQNNASFLYVACSYVGPSGEFWRDAENGTCPLIRFRKNIRSSTR